MKKIKLTKIDSTDGAKLNLRVEFTPKEEEDIYRMQEWKRITTKALNDLVTDSIVEMLKLDSILSPELNRAWIMISMLGAVVEREYGRIYKYRRLEDETGFVFILGPRCYIVNTKDMLVAYGEIPNKKEFTSCPFSDLCRSYGTIDDFYDLCWVM